MLDFLLYLTYVIAFITLLLALVFAFRGMAQNFRKSAKSLFATLGLIVIFVIIWAATSGSEVVNASGEVLASAGESHLVSAALNVFYILISATLLVTIYATISAAIKKR